MRVSFDDQIFSHQVRGGISNYFVNLALEFEAQPSHGVDLSGFPIFTKNAHVMEAGLGFPLGSKSLSRAAILRVSNRALASWRRMRGFAEPEIIHHTYYFDQIQKQYGSARRVVTVHDMTPELYPNDFPGGNPHALKRQHVYEADAIACVSETTKADLLAICPGITAPVLVTPLGVAPEFRPDPMHGDQHGNYFLFVGARGSYKNFDLLLKALAILSKRSKANLLLIGGGPIRSDEAERFARLGLEGRIRQTTPSNRELVDIYRKAICLVFPSKYEGFGLPALEAMASGCPALLSEAPALKEVGGEAGEYFPVDDADYLAAKMLEVERNEEYRVDLQQRGMERSSAFSWSRTASLTRQCYAKAMER